MDDFQVRTPTDVLGQHIHLVKFDVTSSDGAGNGFNYEDGTFSPQEVRERIAAIMAKGGIYQFDERAPFQTKVQTPLEVKPVATEYPLPGHPGVSRFGQPPPFQNWDGAQTTIQRFDTDPTLNNDGLDRTVRSVFTHDHFSPSTHQQTGYYAALLVEPDDSTWNIPVVTVTADGKSTVTYEQGGSRSDGGPTSWEASIITADKAQSYREFAFEFQDMQLAYLGGSTARQQTPSQLTPAQPLYQLGGPAQTALPLLDLGKPIPPGNAVRTDLAANGIVLSDDAVVAAGTMPKTFVITDPQTKTAEGFDTTYPIDAGFNVFTPNMNPGWTDPSQAVAAPKASKTVPTPQLLSFGTVGTYSVNYRNEPLPLRVAGAPAPVTSANDLAFAYASITRTDPDLNVQPTVFELPSAVRGSIAPGNPKPDLIAAFAAAGVALPNTSQIIVMLPPDPTGWTVTVPNAAGTSFTVYQIRDPGPPVGSLFVMEQVSTNRTHVFPPPVVPLSADAKVGGVTGPDPFTPMMRAYANDRVQVRALAGAHMDEHSFLIHGVNYFFEPSYTNSGYQTTQAISLSEHFEMAFTVPAKTATQTNEFADFLYAPSANAQGQTSGTWGILRAYDGTQNGRGDKTSPFYLEPLPNNPTGQAPQTIDFAALFSAPGKQTKTYTVIATTAAQILPNGNLTFNSRGQATQNFPFLAAGGAATQLINPYALIYVRDDTIDSTTHLLKSDARVEPLILRANAGDWIKVIVKNQFDPTNAKFNATFNTTSNQGKFNTGNPFLSLNKNLGVYPTAATIRTSTNVGIHPQLVAYDITKGDGMNVGLNPTETAAPTGDLELYWYAGNLSFNDDGTIKETPIEFGSVNLAAAEPLLQHRKGLIGALIVEPEGSTWTDDYAHLETIPETTSQYDSTGKVTSVTTVPLKTRAVKNVTKDGTAFREFVAVLQTDAYFYQAAGAAPTSTNGPALNYRTEPVQYRYATSGYPPSGAAGTAARLSNALVTPDDPKFKKDPTLADPQTPVFTAVVGQPVRFRWIYPEGPGGDAGGSSQVPLVHGHVFQEEPYVNDSTELGFNPLSQWMGGRFILPGQTVDMLFSSAGGSFQVPGDYFYGTFIGQTTGNGQTQALWGLFRVTPPPPGP